MPRAFVLMKALPPTRGHLDLIRFAYGLSTHVEVIVCTRSGEPFVQERVVAVRQACEEYTGVSVEAAHDIEPQEPRREDDAVFWDAWRTLLQLRGFKPGDYVVASEPYGKRLAEEVGGTFMPYDLLRSVNYTRATEVRLHPSARFEDILPQFQRYLRKRVTIFGAESVGKTTTAKALAALLPGTYFFEWARPYLESVGPELGQDKMTHIVSGQYALQRLFHTRENVEYVIQDTDLYSTLGYWETWDKESVPKGLSALAWHMKSDLYIILASNVPFQPDPLRYGIDKRETDDAYWINLCQRENLPYLVVTETGEDRVLAALRAVLTTFDHNPLAYTRELPQEN